MSPWVMVLGVAGIPALALLGWLLGFARPRRIADGAEVRAVLGLRDPSAMISELVLDAQGRAALALLADGRLFAVRALGDRLVDRVLPPQALQRVQRKEDGLMLVFSDFTFPGLRLHGVEAPAWLPAVERTAAHADV